jgi:Holliday junction resolvase RusA-like endonuclease
MILTIPGQPIAKKRPRFSTHHGYVQTYDCQGKEKKEFQMKLLIEKNKQEYFFEDDDVFRLDFIFAIEPAKSLTKREKERRLYGCTGPGLEGLHTIKADLDNLQKFVLDCGNQLLWSDDCKIFEIHALKVWSLEPYTKITIEKFK